MPPRQNERAAPLPIPANITVSAIPLIGNLQNHRIFFRDGSGFTDSLVTDRYRGVDGDILRRKITGFANGAIGSQPAHDTAGIRNPGITNIGYVFHDTSGFRQNNTCASVFYSLFLMPTLLIPAGRVPTSITFDWNNQIKFYDSQRIKMFNDNTNTLLQIDDMYMYNGILPGRTVSDIYQLIYVIVGIGHHNGADNKYKFRKFDNFFISGDEITL